MAEEYKQKIWGNCLEIVSEISDTGNAVSSFQTSGIVPFNSDIVPADEYIEDPHDNISVATTLTDGDTKLPTNEISTCDQSQSNEQIYTMHQ